MARKLVIAALAAAFTVAVAGPLPADAHHSYAMFDHAVEVELKDCIVKEWQWTSPHVWLYVLVPNGTGEPDKYTLEGANPGVLRREGYGKGTFAPGDKITVYMSPLKSGEKGGALNAVVLPDGRMLGSHVQAPTQ